MSSATACFLSLLPPPCRPRHFLRHLALATATKPVPASASSLALPSSWPWARLRRLRELVPAESTGRLLSSATGSLIVALASASLVLGDAGTTSAFVVSMPRKLQADELATARLFRENTPSVVYITNLAVRWASPSPSQGSSAMDAAACSRLPNSSTRLDRARSSTMARLPARSMAPAHEPDGVMRPSPPSIEAWEFPQAG
ncbi:uncharacterized protein [Miscanthus floridulus]|uniref:uncharacterized protein n=1 Tax=Miscanthus floridulus TaxID=154761 RepID=UPI0034584A8A